MLLSKARVELCKGKQSGGATLTTPSREKRACWGPRWWGERRADGREGATGRTQGSSASAPEKEGTARDYENGTNLSSLVVSGDRADGRRVGAGLSGGTERGSGACKRRPRAGRGQGELDPWRCVSAAR